MNTYLPVMADALLESVTLLANVSRLMGDKMVAGLEADVEQCRRHADRSPSLATALNPLIGYDAAAAITKQAIAEGRPLSEVAAEQTDLTDEQISAALDPAPMARPPRHLTRTSGGDGGEGADRDDAERRERLVLEDVEVGPVGAVSPNRSDVHHRDEVPAVDSSARSDEAHAARGESEADDHPQPAHAALRRPAAGFALEGTWGIRLGDVHSGNDGQHDGRR